jgi:hypothetical protein
MSENEHDDMTDKELMEAICLDVARWIGGGPTQRTLLTGVANGLVHQGLVHRYAITLQGNLFVELTDGRLLRMSAKLFGNKDCDPAASVIGYDDLCWKVCN